MRFKVLEERFKSSSRNIVTPEKPVSNGRQSLGGLQNLSRSSSSRFSSRNIPKNGRKVHDCSKLLESNKVFPSGPDDHVDELGENGKDNMNHKDFVSGMLYDMLQKEVLTLKKACHQKDQNLKDKDNTIEVRNLLFLMLIMF